MHKPLLPLSTTVNRIHDLPGTHFFEAVDTDATEVEASVAVPRNFAAYEKTFDLPVYRLVKVTVVCDRGERLRIETDRGNLSARGFIWLGTVPPRPPSGQTVPAQQRQES